MSKNANKPAALTEVVIATTLAAIGLSTGQTPLVGLANIGAAIGSSWGASLLEKSYQNWSRQWFGKNGVLDDDISRALIHALQKAVKELESELKEHKSYQRLQHHNAEAGYQNASHKHGRDQGWHQHITGAARAARRSKQQTQYEGRDTRDTDPNKGGSPHESV